MKDEEIKDKDFFFLNRSAFEKTFQELENKKAVRLPVTWLISTIITLLIPILTTKEYVPILFISASYVELILLIIIISLSVLLIIFLIIKFINIVINKKWEKINIEHIKKALYKNSEELNMYTLLLLIPDCSTNKLCILAKKEPDWDYALFLPHIKCSFEEYNTLKELNNILHRKITSHINFIYEPLHELEIKNDIKFHKDQGVLRRYNYKFIFIYPNSNFLFDIFINEFKDQGYDFYSIPDMKEDKISWERNSTIINKLNEYGYDLNKKFNLLNRNSNRLVWNISECCNHGCEFCAFGNYDIAKINQKLDIDRIIQQLNKIKIKIIDISCGDLLDIEYLKECIVELKKAGYEINLTATYVIIKKLDINFIKKNITMIEFSYDSLENDVHRSKGYNDNNYSCIKDLSKKLQKHKISFKALIILYIHLTYKNFKKIIQKLQSIDVKDATLIRLMPVGSMSKKQYPEKLLKKEFYKDYLDFCNDKKDFKIIPHCSFDGMNKKIKYCNKGISKLSMGPTGDIYSCPWGEHLSNGNKKYYLGNILYDNIIDNINNQDFSFMEKNIFSCGIFDTALGEDYIYENKK